MPFFPKIVGVIPARFESSRFRGKLLVPICGKSLIQRTYENAKKFKELQEIVIATDDARIFDHVKTFGAKVMMTAKEHPTGTDRLAEMAMANSECIGADYIFNIQGDEPCLQPDVVSAVANALIADPTAAMSTAVVALRSKELALSPSVVKCVMDLQGNALYFSRSLIPLTQQGSFDPNHIYYRHLGVYCYTPEFLKNYSKLQSSPLENMEKLEQLRILEHGFRIKVARLQEEVVSIGVDVPEDIKKLEEWLNYTQNR